jgi:hypothetical protein
VAPLVEALQKGRIRGRGAGSGERRDEPREGDDTTIDVNAVE